MRGGVLCGHGRVWFGEPPRRGTDDTWYLTTDRRRAMMVKICAARKSASGFLKTAKSASDRRRKLALRRLPPFPSPKLKGLELRLQAARQLSGWQRFTLAARRNGCPPRPSPHCVWNNAHHRELMCQTSVKSISAINLDFVKLQQISAKITDKNNRIH